MIRSVPFSRRTLSLLLTLQETDAVQPMMKSGNSKRQSGRWDTSWKNHLNQAYNMKT